MTLPDKEMSGLMARSKHEREARPFYLEHFDADISNADTELPGFGVAPQASLAQMQNRQRGAIADRDSGSSPTQDFCNPTTAERERGRITPSQPSREVERQKYSRAMDTLFLIWVGFIFCMAFAGLLITAYQAVFP